MEQLVDDYVLTAAVDAQQTASNIAANMGTSLTSLTGASGSIAIASSTTGLFEAGTLTGTGGIGVSLSGASPSLVLTIAITSPATARSTLGIDDIATKKSNLTAVVAPTVNEDSGDGYAIGSMWIDTVLKDVYVLADATVAAAVWRKLN